MLVLVGVILISIASMLYLGAKGNEPSVAMIAAQDGAENAIFWLAAAYECAIEIEEVEFSAGLVTIEVAVRYAPPPGFTWENFSENVVEPTIREQALKYLTHAVTGSFPVETRPVQTSYYTYDVEVVAERVVR
jgi:hypothetical protein